jgi:hypothetical protein
VKEWKELPPDLLAARQRLLDGIMATWTPPAAKKVARHSRPLTVRELRDALEQKATVLAEKARKARDDERRAINDIVAAKGSMPNNYWLPRHMAAARLDNCLFLLTALDEALNEERKIQ